MPTVTITTPGAGTFTVPAGIGTITVECWGAGGGGSSGSTQYGGGGGAYTRKVVSYPDISPNTTYDVYVGNGGGGGPFGPSGGNGVDGEGTWFINSGYVFADFGLGGYNNLGIPGEGGQAANCIGDTSFSGGNGSSGLAIDTGGGGAGGSEEDGQNGADGGAGGNVGGGAGGITSGSVGGAGTQPGGGGGPTSLNLDGDYLAGGDGAPGQITITYNDPLDHFSITGTPTATQSGTTFGFTVTAKTADNTTMTWYYGGAPYVTITSSAAHGTYFSSLALVSGVYTVPASGGSNITSLGTFHLIASDGTVTSNGSNIIINPHSQIVLAEDS